MDRTAMIERYRTGADDVENAIAGVTDAELDRRPPSGAWTAREIVHHLADSETMAAIRLRRLIADDDPVLHGYDEPVWARRLHYDRPIGSSLALVRAVRDASLDLLERLTPADWARIGVHTESGPYAVDDWLGIYAEHAHEHADQIRRARRGED